MSLLLKLYASNLTSAISQLYCLFSIIFSWIFIKNFMHFLLCSHLNTVIVQSSSISSSLYYHSTIPHPRLPLSIAARGREFRRPGASGTVPRPTTRDCADNSSPCLFTIIESWTRQRDTIVMTVSLHLSLLSSCWRTPTHCFFRTCGQEQSLIITLIAQSDDPILKS